LLYTFVVLLCFIGLLVTHIIDIVSIIIIIGSSVYIVAFISIVSSTAITFAVKTISFPTNSTTIDRLSIASQTVQLLLQPQYITLHLFVFKLQLDKLLLLILSSAINFPCIIDSNYSNTCNL